MSASTLEKLDALASTNLARELRLFLTRHPDEKPYVDAIERELKRFLSLPLLVPDAADRLAPSPPVDELWHDLILNTPKYRHLCDTVYGGYLDHAPNQEELSDERAATIIQFTHSTLIKYYGFLDLTIWGSDILSPCEPPAPRPILRPRSGLKL